ncbi:WRKY DNA-binding transcription factor 70-like, partial [Telopea speciosissima]|uniref:WRKY DNA-binding transcription factor 70-like n=1 Tax=Telopea speciosissima TaxID=54955 RepID=UPI001CC773A9
SGKVPATSPAPPCRDQNRKRSKRRNVQESWTRITAVPIEDGYAWRKYGQKEILNAKHLRCYFRCSYRFDQGCQATKQVQRTEDELLTFWTKYTGHHTCQDILKASLGMDSTAEEGVLLSFNSNTTIKQEPHFFSSFPSSKEEHKKPIIPSIEQQEYKPSSSSEYYLPVPHDLITKFKSSMNPTSALPSTSKSPGHGDFVSRGTTSSSSSSSFDMDMELMDSVCLNDVFYDEELF